MSANDGERARDPFSLMRANVGLHNPHLSHFLHPVLRYYAGGALVAVTHVLEDFHGEWTLLTPHILPIARMLEEVGAKRCAAAKEVVSTPDSTTFLGALDKAWTPLPWASRPALLSAPATWPRSNSGGITFANCLMQSDKRRTTLHFNGGAVKGKEGWSLQLSVAAENAFISAPSIIAMHFFDPEPQPLSPAELAWTAENDALWNGARPQHLEGGSEFTLDPSVLLDAARNVPPPPPASQAAADARDAVAPAIARAYGNLTSTLLAGLPVMTVQYRAGPSRLVAEQFGAVKPGEPSGRSVIRVFDTRPTSGGGRISTIDATDLDAGLAELVELYKGGPSKQQAGSIGDLAAQAAHTQAEWPRNLRCT